LKDATREAGEDEFVIVFELATLIVRATLFDPELLPPVSVTL
jgi:hypothetical protein